MNKVFIILFFFTIQVLGQESKPYFLAPPDHFLLSADLHTHSVFSDGSVWPDIRVKEAIRENIDLLAITEHLEYQPYKEDIPHPDRNRSFILADTIAKSLQSKLRIISGAEITRKMPPGHLNAIFINDANTLLYEKDSIKGVEIANKQGAFVFWNHPMWGGQEKDGISRLYPIHKHLIKNKLLHGIEVVNLFDYSQEALKIALENNLTILGTSDIHGLINWEWNLDKGGHRPLTFIITKDDSFKGIKNALFKRKTMVWFNNLIIGEEQNISPIVNKNLELHYLGYGEKSPNFEEDDKGSLVLKVNLKNNSALPYKLLHNGDYTFMSQSNLIEIPPYDNLILRVKTIKKKDKIDLYFKVLNAIIGPQKNLDIILSHD